MKTIVLGMMVFISSAAQAAVPATGRSLPRGEENPKIIVSIFESKAGEVHFLREKGELGQALLRTPGGGLMELVKTEGPQDCDRYATAPISGCSFFFSNGSDGVEILSQELQEQSLFKAVSRGLQARARHVSL
jgi:hypothetical protein